MVELRINIVDEDILENDEDFNIMLSTSETRITISNSTSVIILNDECEYLIVHVHLILFVCLVLLI